jgi:alkyl hydroperoxide reductase subunit AhpC
VVLFFYPRDFTKVCPTELRELGKRRDELPAELLALSVDDVATHRRWIAEVLGELGFPLLADPGGAVARAYGALLEGEGVAARATFAIDPDGVIQYAAAQNRKVGRSISELVRVLEALQTGDAVPVGWQPGQPTLGR